MIGPIRRAWCFAAVIGMVATAGDPAPEAVPAPYAAAVSVALRALESPAAADRRAALGALGAMRAEEASNAAARLLLDDPVLEVRRDAALCLARCGRRPSTVPLLDALSDADPHVRQAAHVALVNLTAIDSPFDALAAPEMRNTAVERLRRTVAAIPADGLTAEFRELLGTRPPPNLARGKRVTVTSMYKGPPEALTDGDPGTFWQTKNVPFPQAVTVDLGEARDVGFVAVEQYGDAFRMTDCSIAISADGETFRDAVPRGDPGATRLETAFPAVPARFVRITSFGTVNPTYPTTFREIEVRASRPQIGDPERRADAARALGAVGTAPAAELLAEALEPHLTSGGSAAPGEKRFIRSALRSLGRLRHPAGEALLIRFLDNPHYARYAADALGDAGTDRVAEALLDAYPNYAQDANRRAPSRVPADDRPGFEAVDRIYETPFAIAAALSRLPLRDPGVLARLREAAPVIAANLPGDYDGAMLYERETVREVTAFLLERAGLRRTALAAALGVFGEEDLPHAGTVTEAETMARLARSAPGGVPYGAAWLSAFARPGECPESLQRLLTHENGWVAMNAAKALLFCGSRESAETLARLLRTTPNEASYGYNGRYLFDTPKQGQDEYEAPSPCRREAFARALGGLGSPGDADLLLKVMNDEGNVLEVRYAAAVSLGRIGGDRAIRALRGAALSHPFHSIRLVAREALRLRGEPLPPSPTPANPRPTPAAAPAEPSLGPPPLVFIRGPNDMPNDFQIDPWRQTYSTTDSGPTYRLGTNLYLLDPPAADGTVTPLTGFASGYVADCEVSGDGRTVVFARRGGDDDPWWHLFAVEADGSGLRRLTSGPYHDVQPDFLPDGRIVFATTRIGMRDEYHGYPATGLATMNPDGSDIRCIGFNLGRDDEPSVDESGRIIFGRLELFYSRLKTERTLQAVYPDGTHNVTLYGPERRDFWRDVTRRSGEGWWGEAPPRHRVLRLTQPQAYGPGRTLCATTAGLTVTGPGRLREEVLATPGMAVTSPFPMPDGRILCAATPRSRSAAEIDLGLYILDPADGGLTPVYNTPEHAEFEARPVAPRPQRPILASSPAPPTAPGVLVCDSAFTTRDPAVRRRGALVRIVEGMPPVARHHTHTSTGGYAWKNHTGTLARVLGTVPLFADGSFAVEIPGDALVHCQILDSDQQVVGNQLIWMYARPGETKSCVGCHEAGDMPPPFAGNGLTRAAVEPPVSLLPHGGEFRYRAKLWQKGTLPDEGEERTRTARAVNVFGRY